MVRLPEDVIVEILVKLPVKTLLRFRYVCKSWCDLIKSPYFIERHLIKNQSPKNNDSFLVIRGLEDETTSLMSFHSCYESLSSVSVISSAAHMEIPHFNDIGIEVCGPCNGLLCLSDTVTIVLCNPAMREFKVLPPSPFPCPKGWEYNANTIGFGFDSNTNDYKVVAFVTLYKRYSHNHIYRAEIYNLSTNSWRELDVNHDGRIYIPYTPGYGTLFNGAFHWIKHSETLSFDMSTEMFRHMRLPDIDPEELKRTRLTVLKESLAMFAYTDPWDDASEQFKFVDIWVMHQYGVAESWTKQFIVGPMRGLWCPFLLWKNEAVLLESNEGRLVSCALDTQQMNDFEIHGVQETLRVMVYQESLISIN